MGTCRKLATIALACLVVALTASVARADSFNGLALTPPMGFNDWNAFHCNVSEDLIKQTALAMHENGMQAAGYDYVNIDDCWMNGRTVPAGPAKVAAGRDADGHLVADPTFFSSGIKALADYVHSLGLKLGIYEDAGAATCQGLAGSLGHEETDAQDFAAWDVDYLKYDWCNVPLGSVPGTTVDEKARLLYTKMSQALVATGRPIVFEAATLGDTRVMPWRWTPAVANLWRTTTDISPNFASMLGKFTLNSTLAQFAGPGHWNDPDMLEIGTGGFTTLVAPVARGDTNVKVASVSNVAVGSALRVGTAAGGDLESAIVESVGTAGATGTGITLASRLSSDHDSGTAVGKSGLSLTESKTHLSLWAMEAAPLIAGTDVVNLAAQNLAIYRNPDVVAVDQDALGVQATVLSNADSHWTLVKPLADGDLAVLLFNAGAAPWDDAGATLASVGADPDALYLSRDLWAHGARVVRGDIHVASIEAHGVAMLRLHRLTP